MAPTQSSLTDHLSSFKIHDEALLSVLLRMIDNNEVQVVRYFLATNIANAETLRQCYRAMIQHTDSRWQTLVIELMDSAPTSDWYFVLQEASQGGKVHFVKQLLERQM
jgi:hypothetical protein